MADLPYMKFFPADFLADCDILSAAAKGAWISFICKAWMARSGSITLKINQWARMFGSTNAEARRIIEEIEDCDVGFVSVGEGGSVTIHSKRIERNLNEMSALKERQSEAGKKAAEAKRLKSGNDPITIRKRIVNESTNILESRSQKSEKKKVKKEKPKGRAESLDEIIDYCATLDLPKSDADYLWNHWCGNGWTNNGKQIKDWKRTVIAWKAANYLPSQKKQQSGEGSSYGSDSPI